MQTVSRPRFDLRERLLVLDRLMVLGAAAQERNTHYGIDDLTASFIRSRAISEGLPGIRGVYACLKRLDAEGLVFEFDGRFCITPAGTDLLFEQVLLP